MTALAGLRKGLAGARYNCGGGVGYGDHFFKCQIADRGGTHGVVGLADAIKVSCNSFFYQMGNAAGINAIDETGETLGLGKATGVEITGEQPGVLPGPDWMRINYPNERWTSAYTANVSIGQGYDLVSPLQLAMVYATVANGGVAYYPRLVQNVVDAAGKPLLNEKGQPVIPQQPKVRGDLRVDFKPEQIELARRGLWDVVNEGGGTGGKARLPNVQVAGKTGTAQAMTDGKNDTIAWFACFAPYDNPRYAIAVMVQGGKGGGAVAAPIAHRILERTLAMEDGKFDPQLAWLAPAQKANPFQFIEAVDFKDSGPNVPAAEDERILPTRRRAAAQLSRRGSSPGCRTGSGRPRASGARATQRAVRVQAAPPPPPRSPISSNDFSVPADATAAPRAACRRQPPPQRRYNP